MPKKYDSQIMEAKHSQSGEKVAVHLNYKKQLEMLDRDMIQQLNIIFKRIFNVLKFKMVSRLTFFLRDICHLNFFFVLHIFSTIVISTTLHLPHPFANTI